jgi:hypothetical protein
MEAKPSDHVWGVKELVGLLEADEAKMIAKGRRSVGSTGRKSRRNRRVLSWEWLSVQSTAEGSCSFARTSLMPWSHHWIVVGSKKLVTQRMIPSCQLFPTIVGFAHSAFKSINYRQLEPFFQRHT